MERIIAAVLAGIFSATLIAGAVVTTMDDPKSCTELAWSADAYSTCFAAENPTYANNGRGTIVYGDNPVITEGK
jgi:hypothetical protein